MKTVKKRSQIQEKSVAKDMGAKTVVASGAMWFSKGDVRNDKFLIECKTTEKDFYSITIKVWEKIIGPLNEVVKKELTYGNGGLIASKEAAEAAAIIGTDDIDDEIDDVNNTQQ